ncbi:MAG: SIS domain-containing protein [Candidatus Falkowbacteria bacterium]
MKNDDGQSKMIEEIREQPEIIKDIINKRVDFKTGRAVFEEFGDDKIRILKNIQRIIFLGCGTSYHAAIYGNYAFEELTGMNCEYETADEFAKREAVIESKTAVILLSQSGETGDVLRAARLAKEKDAFLIGITNEFNSSLAKYADVSVYTEAGQESAVAATKTFTSQIMLLGLLAVYFDSLNRKPPVLSESAITELRSFSDKMGAVLKLGSEIKEIAGKYAQEKGYAVLGEKYNYPIALEAALKLKETAYLHAEGLATGEFRHGPLAIIEKGFPVIFLAPKDPVYEDNARIIKEVKKAGARILAVTTAGNSRLKDLADDIIYIPPALEIFVPVLSIIPLQLLAYEIAVSKGLKIDTPRNLTKYVN